MKKKNFDIYVWACSLEDAEGEGILATNFLNKLFEYSSYNFFVRSPNKFFYHRTIKRIKTKKYIKSFQQPKKNGFLQNYVSPFVGVILLWVNFLQGKKVCYVNYLPLWNTLLFLLLPPKTILGPITGGKYVDDVSNANTFIRKFLFPLLYYMSTKILLLRYSKLLFSTDMLRDYIPVNRINDCFFNFTISNLPKVKKRKQRRDIDFLIYFRKHQTKRVDFQVHIIKQLSQKKIKIYAVGSDLKIKNINNKSYIPRKRLLNYLLRTKYTINSGENFYSIFALDCLACGVKIFYDKNNKPLEYFFPKKNFIEINYRSAKSSLEKIKKFYSKPYKPLRLNNNFFIKKISTRLDNYFKFFLI